MRKGAMILLALGLAVPGAWLLYEGMESAKPKVSSFMNDRGLDDAASQIRHADGQLSEMVARKLGQEGDEDLEIDFLNPTENDMRFLFELLRSGTDEQRLSAARALVEIGDPRAVRPLLRVSAEVDEGEAFCLAAQDLLRHQTRSGAAEWLLDVTEDPDIALTESCRAQLEEKLSLIGASSQAVATDLLFSERPRVKLYALSHLIPEGGDIDVVTRVAALTQDGDPRVAAAAVAWRASANQGSESQTPKLSSTD